MAELNFDKKVILTLYKMFFGEDYPAGSGRNSKDSLKDIHIQTQKMGYLLKLRGFNVGGFHYSWNRYGPFSPGMQAQLRELDQKGDEVCDFYLSCPGEDVVFSDQDVPGSLFMSRDKQVIEQLIAALDIPAHVHEGNGREWMELLGTLAYLSNSELPSVPFRQVESVLMSRKTQYSHSAENKKAWDLLGRAGLLSPWTAYAS